MNDPRFKPYYGWHDDHSTEDMSQYLPAAQQDRGEFHLLMDILCMNLPRMERCLQIGLGMGGGTHVAFKRYFRNVVTVDNTLEAVNWYHMRFGQDPCVMHGNSHASDCINGMRLLGPFDFIFIDGDHTYEGVLADFRAYYLMLVKRGILAFHDAVHLSGVARAVSYLSEGEGFDVKMIGTKIGIAWIQRD
jgi:spermidine synthase